MNNYFNRQIQLWGEDTQNSLQEKHIVIIGCGGLGCSLGIALGASGIGTITLVDFDDVGVHNIHRQIAFRSGDEGRYKCDVLKELIVSRCPFVKVNTVNGSFEDYISNKDLPKVDLILDATDNLPVRAKIDEYAKSINTPWIYGSVKSFMVKYVFLISHHFLVFFL